MEPQETINDLSQALREVHAEDTLHLLIASRLEALRVLYRLKRTPLSRQFETKIKIACYEYELKYTAAGVRSSSD